MSQTTRSATVRWRPVGAAVVVTAGAVAVVLVGAAVVQRQLDRRGLPGCVNPNECWPTGGAMDAILAMQLVAAFVPVLLGLLLGVPLGRRRDAVMARLAVALGVGALCSGVVAVLYRTVAARYTLLANDMYELLELLHLNHVGLMVTRTLFTIAVAALLGLVTRSTAHTLALSLIGWPLGMIAAFAGVALLTVGIDSAPAPEPVPDDWTADISLADGLAWALTAVTAVYVVVVVVLIRRVRLRSPH